MEQVPRISDSEWLVMKVLWGRSSATANEVVAALAAQRSWKPKTVKTLLNRLVGKGVLGYEKVGREYHYRPLVSEGQCAQVETRSFLERVYGGTLRPMLAALVESENLSAEEMEELRRVLDGGREA